MLTNGIRSPITDQAGGLQGSDTTAGGLCGCSAAASFDAVSRSLIDATAEHSCHPQNLTIEGVDDNRNGCDHDAYNPWSAFPPEIGTDLREMGSQFGRDLHKPKYPPSCDVKCRNQLGSLVENESSG